MSFAFPLVLLMMPLPLLMRHLRGSALRRAGGVELPPSIEAGMEPFESGRDTHRVLRLGLALAWILAVIAVAGPRQLQALDLLPASGRDLVLALDLSGSMERDDFHLEGRSVTRLEAVQTVASDFVLDRAGDRVGVVVFGDRAYVAAAPTHDVAAVSHVIETSVIGISGTSTAIADGLGLAVKRLVASDATSRVVILLSDGRNTAGAVDPVAAAAKAAELGVRIHTIALGPQDLETSPDARDAVDSETLRRIAEASGGEMFRVRGAEDLRAVTQAIDALEPSALDAPPIRAWREWWIWPAGAALALLAALLLAQHRITA